MKKTNAMRILDGLGISYETAEYEDDGVMHKESKEICVFCQSAESEINLKKARQAAGCKEIGPVRPEELLGLTGYIRGGCTPIGMKKKFRTFIDETIILHDQVCISGGQRGVQIKIAPNDLIKATDATVVDLEL